MKRLLLLTALLTSALVSVAVLLPQRAKDRAFAASPAKDSGRPCSVAMVAGDWAARFSGQDANGEAMGIGTFHLNEDGTSSAHLWINMNGTTFLEVTRTGTTIVNADCTATQSWDDGGPIAKSVILRNGREMWATYDQPAFANVILKRIDEPL